MRPFHWLACLSLFALTSSASSASGAPQAAAKTIKATKVAMNEGRVCALIDDGTVRCWGDDIYGNGEHHTPVVMAGVSRAIDVDVMLSGACARHADGTATCWGDSSFLEIDRKQTDTSSKPHRATVLTSATELVTSGGGDGCAKYKDGTFKCWGSGAAYLAVGKPASTAPVPCPSSPRSQQRRRSPSARASDARACPTARRPAGDATKPARWATARPRCASRRCR